ncbi:MAG: hypothetical protein DID91_2727703249 [Candidatus Nitrotoga sp. MKT]|nr:MAG: hypothetical protein DID91_2727703249 [Candidatus Nitrotoga sp. MKT]
MSGFLHRLAAQAMGRTNTLRSAVRTPYAPFSPVNGVEPDTQAATLNPIDTERQHRGNGDAERASVANQEQQHVDTYAEIDIQPRANEIAPSLPEILVTKPDISLHTKSDRPSGLPSSAKTMLRQPSMEKTVAGEPPVLAEEIEMRVPENDSTTLPGSNYPTPLLPLKNAARPSALNASVAAQRSEHSSPGRQGQADEITEVHVSIGRIEVTAVHEPPPPKRQAPTSAKPLSLDEYLARRGKKT